MACCAPFNVLILIENSSLSSPFPSDIFLGGKMGRKGKRKEGKEDWREKERGWKKKKKN